MATRRGFTLIEAIIALTIFTILMAALSMCVNAALSADSISHQRLDDAGTARAIFDSLTRDIQSAFASPNSPASVFIAGGGGAGNGNNISANSLLTLTTLNQHIPGDSLLTGQSNGQSTAQTATQTPFTPQSDVVLIQYALEQQSDGTTQLKRYITSVPNTQLAGPSQNDQTSMATSELADNVVDLSLQFYDRSQQTWRTDWDYEQQNQQTQSNQAQGGSNGATGGANASPQTTPTGDSGLPGAVQITLQIRTKKGGVVKFTTSVPIIAPQPQPTTNAIPTSGGNGTPNSGGS
jgi:prepilin-type N-terminal cleavage/methylation domain-containing protein